MSEELHMKRREEFPRKDSQQYQIFRAIKWVHTGALKEINL